MRTSPDLTRMHDFSPTPILRKVTMRVLALGHVVLKVRDLERAIAFYSGVLGLKPVAQGTFGGRRMVFYSFAGNHHDLALAEVGPQALIPAENGTGLAHVALKVGDTLDQLRAVRSHLQSHQVTIDRTVDHRVAHSLYVRDPDENRIELYVDGDPALWREDPATVAHSEPFVL